MPKKRAPKRGANPAFNPDDLVARPINWPSLMGKRILIHPIENADHIQEAILIEMSGAGFLKFHDLGWRRQNSFQVLHAIESEKDLTTQLRDVLIAHEKLAAHAEHLRLQIDARDRQIQIRDQKIAEMGGRL